MFDQEILNYGEGLKNVLMQPLHVACCYTINGTMKRYQRCASLLILLLAIATIISCKKEDQHHYMNNAQVIGYDLRLCVCCGGYQVTIDNAAKS